MVPGVPGRRWGLKLSDVEVLPDAERLGQAYRDACPDDFLLFTLGLTIPSAAGPRLFSSCIQPFQTRCFRALAPTLHAVRDGLTPPIRRFWIERTKKAGKDSDLACCLLWLMAFPRRPILVQVCAANQKQAGIIKRRAADLLFYNFWLNGLVQIQQNRILPTNRMGEVVVEATDTSGGAHGETPDLLVLNELVHVAKWSAMEAHRNNADGVPRGVVVVSTNAGIKGTKAELWRKAALNDSNRWKVEIWNKRSPWTNKGDVDEARKRDPIGAEFSRLWEGKWVSGTGDAVDDAAIDRCFCLDGPLDKLEKGQTCVAGLDLGVSHDHAGLAVTGVCREDQRIKLAYMEGWEPDMRTEEGKLEVNLMDVEKRCLWANQAFSPVWFGYDPAAGGSFMAQRLRKQGVPMREMTFAAPSNLTLMARSFVLSVKGGRLECYDDWEGRLRRDFGKFNIEHRPPSNYKLVAVSDEYGHADVGTALVICLPKALELLGGFAALDDGDLVDAGDGTLTEKEVEGMPDDLRAIYESCDDQEGARGRKKSRREWDDRELF
jgi:hypothetical protein